MNLLHKSSVSPDSLHANFIAHRSGTVFITHSFVCQRDRLRALKLAIDRLGEALGYRRESNRGVLLNLGSGKVLSSGGVVTLTGKRVLSGLPGAHDGVFYDDRFYVNATHNIETRIYDGSLQLLDTIPYGVGMVLRGLHPVDKDSFLVGATRIDPARTASSIYTRVLRARGQKEEFDRTSSLKVVDRSTGEVQKAIELDPFQGRDPEIYKIISLVP
jgi:hypothetical protein